MFIVLVAQLMSCNSKYSYLNLSGSEKSKERVAYVKSFTTEFFSKCEKEDFSEIKNYPMSINMKNRLEPENFRKLCSYYTNKYGKVTVGELSSASTDYSARDFLDNFFFHAKGSKNDSLQYVRVKVYRDDNMIERISIPNYKTNKK